MACRVSGVVYSCYSSHSGVVIGWKGSKFCWERQYLFLDLLREVRQKAEKVWDLRVQNLLSVLSSVLLDLNTFLVHTFPAQKENCAWIVVFYYTRTFLYTLLEQGRLFEAVTQETFVRTFQGCPGMLWLSCRSVLCLREESSA